MSRKTGTTLSQKLSRADDASMRHRNTDNFVPLPPDAPDVVRALHAVNSLDLAIIGCVPIAHVHTVADRLGIAPSYTIELYSHEEAERIDAAIRAEQEGE